VQDHRGDRHTIENRGKRRNLGHRYAGKKERAAPKKAEKQELPQSLADIDRGNAVVRNASPMVFGILRISRHSNQAGSLERVGDVRWTHLCARLGCREKCEDVIVAADS
jgi:hypothetical protein